jgi:hypothetical protein
MGKAVNGELIAMVEYFLRIPKIENLCCPGAA